MANRYWKVVEAPDIVNAPNIHVSPNRVMIPKVLIMSLFVCFCVLLAIVLAPTEVKECLMSTLRTMTKMAQLKRNTASMGDRKAPKNTAGSPMKQLQVKKNIK